MGASSAGVLPLQAEPLSDAQEKTALLQVDGQWCLPRGATPSSHIFKLPLGLIGGMKLDMTHSVENEWLCATVLKAFGLPVAACRPLQFENMKALVVERFDRAWWTGPAGDQRLIRLPQDIRPGGRYQLTPLYDVLSAYPVLGEGPSKISALKAKMAMSVRAKNAHWKMQDILRRHGLAVGARHGVIADDGLPAESIVDDLLARTPEVVAAVRQQLPQDFPLPLADSILGGLQDAANKLAA